MLAMFRAVFAVRFCKLSFLLRAFNSLSARIGSNRSSILAFSLKVLSISWVLILEYMASPRLGLLCSRFNLSQLHNNLWKAILQAFVQAITGKILQNNEKSNLWYILCGSLLLVLNPRSNCFDKVAI